MLATSLGVSKYSCTISPFMVLMDCTKLIACCGLFKFIYVEYNTPLTLFVSQSVVIL
jgi:hypothetical protein